jgi:hypothetical protein
MEEMLLYPNTTFMEEMLLQFSNNLILTQLAYWESQISTLI